MQLSGSILPECPCTPGPGQQPCTAAKRGEVFDSIRRAAWRQGLVYIVPLPLGGSCGKRVVGGSSGTDSAPGTAAIPGADPLGPAVGNKPNKTPTS